MLILHSEVGLDVLEVFSNLNDSVIVCGRDHTQDIPLLPLTGHFRGLLASANMFPSSEKIFFLVTFSNPFVHDGPGCT